MQRTIQEVMRATKERDRNERPEYNQWLASLRLSVRQLSAEEEEERRWREGRAG